MILHGYSGSRYLLLKLIMKSTSFIKISNEMCKDSNCLLRIFGIVIKNLNKSVYDKGILKTKVHEVYFVDCEDDFLKNMKTVVFSYYKFKVPRIIKMIKP